MSFTVQVGPVLAARLNSMSCSYWSSQASSRKGLNRMRAPRRRSSLLSLILRLGAGMIFSFTRDENPAPKEKRRLAGLNPLNARPPSTYREHRFVLAGKCGSGLLHLRHNGAAPLGLGVYLAGIKQGLRR